MNAKISNIGTKLQVGAAACALAGAAALAQGPVAQASPLVPLPAAGLGSSAEVCDEVVTEECVSPFASANAVGAGLFENEYFWFGPMPENPPEDVAVFKFNLIPLFPESMQEALYAWWESVLPNGFQACFLGLTYSLDSYSTMTLGVTKLCEDSE